MNILFDWALKLIPLIIGVACGLLVASPWFEFWSSKRANQLIKDLHRTIYSLLFLALLIPVSFLVMTSTGSYLGTGLVLGLNLQISLTLLRLHKSRQLLIAKFFGQLKREPSAVEVNFLTWFWLAWTVFCFLLLFVNLIGIRNG